MSYQTFDEGSPPATPPRQVNRLDSEHRLGSTKVNPTKSIPSSTAYIRLKNFSDRMKKSPSSSSRLIITVPGKISPRSSKSVVVATPSQTLSNSPVSGAANPAKIATSFVDAVNVEDTADSDTLRSSKTLPAEMQAFSWRESIILALHYLEKPSTIGDIRDWVEDNIPEKYHEVFKSSVSSILAQHKGKFWRTIPERQKRNSARIKYELVRNNSNFIKPLLARFEARLGTAAGNVPALLSSLNSASSGLVETTSDLFTSGEATATDSQTRDEAIDRVLNISAANDIKQSNSGTLQSIEQDHCVSVTVTGMNPCGSDETTPFGSDRESSRNGVAPTSMSLDLTRNTPSLTPAERILQVNHNTPPELDARVQYPSRRELLVDFVPPVLIKPHKISRKGGLTAKQMNETSAAFVQHQFKRKLLEEEHVEAKRRKIRAAYCTKAQLHKDLSGGHLPWTDSSLSPTWTSQQ
jgi:hypothetical protein